MADNQQENTQQGTQQEASAPLLRIPTNSTTLKLQFGTLSGNKTWSYNYANSAADQEDVKALMQTMITNGDIFTDPPLVAKAAWTETKTVYEYDLSI